MTEKTDLTDTSNTITEPTVDVSAIEGSVIEPDNNNTHKTFFQDKKHVKIVSGVVISLIIILGIVVSVLISHAPQRPYGSIINDSADAIVNADWDKYSQYLSPEQKNKINSEIKAGTIENGTAFMQSMRAIFIAPFGDDFKITMKEKSSVKLNKDETLASQDSYNLFFNSNQTFKDAYRVTVDMTIEGNLKSETSEVFYIVAKLNKNWVILNSTFS